MEQPPLPDRPDLVPSPAQIPGAEPGLASRAQAPAGKAGPGRKRSEESRLAILAAAWELVGELGFGALTIEGISARSGTGKQTVYRWWPSKADVLLDALATQADLHIPIPDDGSYTADLLGFLTASYQLGRDPRVVHVLRVLMAQAQIDDDFGDRFRESFLRRRRDALAVVVDRARARGDLPANPPPDLVADVIFGVIWYRVLARSEAVDEQIPAQLAALLAGPPVPSASSAPSAPPTPAGGART
jgi:AcrR family transcriptional regulator